MQIERVLRFTDVGVETTTAVASNSSNWSMFDELVEAPNYFALRMSGSSTFMILPKRGFETTGDDEAFRRLTSQHLPDRNPGP
jgi:hypothetical protein